MHAHARSIGVCSSAGAGGAAERRPQGTVTVRAVFFFSSFHPSPNLLYFSMEQRQGRTFVCFLRTLEILQN